MISKYKERELAEYMLQNGFNSRNRFYELSVLSRYLYSIGKTKEEIQEDIVKFCERYFENFNYVKYRNKLYQIFKNCTKYKLIQVDTIDITREELKMCTGLGSFEESKLLFTLLCLYKLHKQLYDNKFINLKYSTITKMAHITTVKKMIKLLTNLCQKGFVRVCINGSIEWVYELPQPEEDEIIIKVYDIDNCGLYYVDYIKGGYKECRNCGRMIRRSSNNKYCDSCKKIVKNEQNKKYYHKKQGKK